MVMHFALIAICQGIENRGFGYYHFLFYLMGPEFATLYGIYHMHDFITLLGFSSFSLFKKIEVCRYKLGNSVLRISFIHQNIF